jgi:hypothetical protein
MSQTGIRILDSRLSESSRCLHVGPPDTTGEASRLPRIRIPQTVSMVTSYHSSQQGQLRHSAQSPGGSISCLPTRTPSRSRKISREALNDPYPTDTCSDEGEERESRNCRFLNDVLIGHVVACLPCGHGHVVAPPLRNFFEALKLVKH